MSKATPSSSQQPVHPAWLPPPPSTALTSPLSLLPSSCSPGGHRSHAPGEPPGPPRALSAHCTCAFLPRGLPPPLPHRPGAGPLRPNTQVSSTSNTCPVPPMIRSSAGLDPQHCLPLHLQPVPRAGCGHPSAPRHSEPAPEGKAPGLCSRFAPAPTTTGGSGRLPKQRTTWAPDNVSHPDSQGPCREVRFPGDETGG